MSAPEIRGKHFWEYSYYDAFVPRHRLEAKLERFVWGSLLAVIILMCSTAWIFCEESAPATPPSSIPPMPANFQATPTKDNIPHDAPKNAQGKIEDVDPVIKNSFIPGEVLPGYRYPQLGYPKDTERLVQVQATAYWTHDPDDASGHGIAYDGTPAVAYKTIAVDPRFIPLQAEVFVPGIGWCRANDTGNAIKGPIIDIAMPNRKAAWAWGRRIVTVAVRTPQKEGK